MAAACRSSSSSSLRPSLALLLLGLAGVAVCADTEYHKGEGTAYSGTGQKNKTGFNSCQFGKLDAKWEKMYAALPSHVFNKTEDCGKCIHVRGTEKDAPGDWVTVMVVDECASCKGDGDVDFSIEALKSITGYSWDRKKIEWEWVDCEEETKEAKKTAKKWGRRLLSQRRQ